MVLLFSTCGYLSKIGGFGRLGRQKLLPLQQLQKRLWFEHDLSASAAPFTPLMRSLNHCKQIPDTVHPQREPAVEPAVALPVPCLAVVSGPRGCRVEGRLVCRPCRCHSQRQVQREAPDAGPGAGAHRGVRGAAAVAEPKGRQPLPSSRGVMGFVRLCAGGRGLAICAFCMLAFREARHWELIRMLRNEYLTRVSVVMGTPPLAQALVAALRLISSASMREGPMEEKSLSAAGQTLRRSQAVMAELQLVADGVSERPHISANNAKAMCQLPPMLQELMAIL